MTLDEAISLRRQARGHSEVVVFTNGVFDLLHVGHVRYLREARSLGGVLLVGLNSDASTRGLKGPDRPLVPEDERRELIEALSCVNGAVLFDTPTATHLIEALEPDIYVKGGDYQVEALPETPAVRRYGGQVRILQHVAGRSSSDLIETIRARFCS